jgi:hypothetical protein
MSKSLIASILFLLSAVQVSSAQTPICPTITQYLTVGSRSAQVITLKEYLISQKLLPAGLTTTYFGPSTAEALKTWQKRRGLISFGTPATTGYGATGPKTRAALKNCANRVTSQPVVQTASTSLTIGSRGAHVSALQQQLIAAKLLPADALTGYYGPLTKAAHERFKQTQANTATTATSTQAPSSTTNTSRTTTVTTSGGGNTTTPTTYTWTTTAWSVCANSIQTRSANCTASTNQTVADTICTQTKPTTTQSCTTTVQPQSCTFNTQTIAHGASIAAYQSSTVVYGQSCVPETRICTDGTLSGSYTKVSCTTQQGQVCMFNGQTIPHQGTVTAYEAAGVSAGQTCASQTRTCTNGTLSGTYNYAVCTVNQQSTAAITVNGASGTVPLKVGDTVMYAWTSTNTTACTMNYSGPTTGNAPLQTVSGTLNAGTLAAAQVGTYYVNITCSTTGGVSVTSNTLTIPVTAQTPAVQNAAAITVRGQTGTMTAKVGESFDIAWTSTNAKVCTLNFSGPAGQANNPLGTTSGNSTLRNFESYDVGTNYINTTCTTNDNAGVQSNTVIIQVSQATPSSFKMSDYWPTVTAGVNKIYHFDSGLVDLYYAETTLPYTYNLANYLNGILVSMWRIRINTTSGAVDEVGDYCPPNSVVGDCTWYDPSLPIIWGSIMAIGETKSAAAATVYETLTLKAHHPSIVLGGTTYTDVIEIDIIQTWNGGGVEITYWFQKGVGIIKTHVTKNYAKPAEIGQWTLTKKCETSTPDQIACP